MRFESVRGERKVSSLWLVGLAMRTIIWSAVREYWLRRRPRILSMAHSTSMP